MKFSGIAGQGILVKCLFQNAALAKRKELLLITQKEAEDAIENAVHDDETGKSSVVVEKYDFRFQVTFGGEEEFDDKAYDAQYGEGLALKTLGEIKALLSNKSIKVMVAMAICGLLTWISIVGYSATEAMNGVTWHYCEIGDSVMLEYTNLRNGFRPHKPAFEGVLPSVLKVPSRLCGRDVTEIGLSAFQFPENSGVETIVIPEGVRKFTHYSFMSDRCEWESVWSSYDLHYEYCYWMLMSESGIKNILFCGDSPDPDWEKSVYTVGDTRYLGRWNYSDAWAFNAYSQFRGCTLWTVEGTSGWDVFSNYASYCGYTVKIGAARTMISVPNHSVVTAGSEIVLSCSNPNAKIFYTLDGSDPVASETDKCSQYVSPIEVHGYTTIKSLSYVKGYPYTVVTSGEYALGNTAKPEFGSPEVFSKSNTRIVISCPTGEAIVRYTLDDTPVMEDSSIYTMPFTVSETTTVRAKAFKTDWFDSEEVVQTFTRLWYTNETPVISAESAAFDAASQEVTILCATEGATVYYTIDGSEPSAANGRVYKGPFNIYDSVTVKAIAVKNDWKDSAVASVAFTKNNGLSVAINMYDYLPDNDVNAPWTVDTEVSHDGVKSARSGAIGENGVTSMKVTVRGAGRLSFWWKSECEEWDEDYYDYGAFCVGSEAEQRLRIAGMTDWRREEIVFEGTGKHVCKWEYHKDDAETIPRDCIWVDQVQWLPYGESEHDHTLTTEVPVPYRWLESYGFGRETDFETAAKMKLGKVDGAGRAMSVEDDYIAGTDPTNLESKLTATIKMGVDGKPIVSWTPPLNGETADGSGIREGVRSYSVYGKRILDDAVEEWTPVTEGTEGNYRFFKVGVGMPTK